MLICSLIIISILLAIVIKLAIKKRKVVDLSRTFNSFDVCVFFIIMLSFSLIVCVVSIMCSISVLATENIIDGKIAMYEQENTRIESEIDQIVQNYIKYEKETFENVKSDESSIVLVTLFPELKSDELVKSQLEVYVSNNEKIKELREDKIELRKVRWDLYFGR